MDLLEHHGEILGTPTPREKIVLGLDLSSVNSGYAIFEGNKLVTYGSIIPEKHMDHCQKLGFIYSSIQNLFIEYKIDDVAIEDQHLRSNVDTLKLLSRIGGVAMLCAHQYGAKVTLYPAPTIKLAFTGSGKSDKKAMIAKAMELYKMERQTIDDNIADAIGCAFTHLSKAGAM